MARQFDGSNGYLQSNSYPVGDEPVSMAAWFNSDKTSGAQTIVTIGNSGARIELSLLLVSDDVWSLSQTSLGNNVQAVSTAPFLANVWNHACGVWASSSDRRVYLNGENKGTETTDRDPSTFDMTRIGQRGNPFDNQKFDGEIAEVAIWNTALTDIDAHILSIGYSPRLIKPQNLVLYIPLIRDNDVDIVGGLNFSVVGSGIDITRHPRIFYPRK
jgi:hypothetical protein